MLAGQRAFGGDTVSDTIAAILEREPEWERLPPATPTKVSDLLRRCLRKDPHQRLHDIADARIEIDDAMAGGTDTAVPPVVASTGRGLRWLPWIIAATAVAVAAFALIRGGGEEQSVLPQTLAMTIRLEDEQNMADDGFAALTPSPDGQYLLWTTRQGIYLQQRSSLEHSFVPTPTQVKSAGFSPDSRWVAYSHSGKLFRQRVTGGAAVEICEVSAGRGLGWVDEQTIVMSIDYASPLYLISVADGSMREFTKLKAEERSHRWPFVVPEGNEVLFMTQLPGRDYQDSDIEAVSLTDGSRRTIYRGGAFPRYAPSGHLLFARNDVLLATSYQPGSDSAHSIATPILQGILTFVGDQRLDDGSAQYGFDAQGTLLYRTALSRTEAESKMAWLDLETGEIEMFGESAHFSDPKVSPNGQHLAVRRGRGKESQVFVRDLETGSERALTSDRGTKYMGAWDNASEFVYWTQANANASMFEIRRAPRDGRSNSESIFEYPQSLFVEQVTHDGRWLYVTYSTPEESYNTGRIELGIDEPTLELVLGGVGEQSDIRFSPNGRFIVYLDGPGTSNSERYVRRVPDTGVRWLLGSGRKGFTEMYWSADGSAIYELDSEGIQAHPVTIAGEAVLFGEPRFLHSTTWLMRKDAWDTDLHPDGDRLVVLMSEHPTNDAGSRIVWQTEWFDELRRMTGSD
jgi:hypothetical protein